MRTFIKLGSLALTASLMLAFGCGSDDDGGGDDDSSNAGGTGGTGGSGGDGGTTSSATNGGGNGGSGGTMPTTTTTDGGGDGGTTSSTDGGGSGGTTSSTNGGGAGGAPPTDEPPYANDDCIADGGPSDRVTDSGVGAFAESADWLADWTNFSLDESGTDCSGTLTAIDTTEDEGILNLTDDETTLTAADSPYALDTQVHVADGQTLTIEPGVVFCGGPDGSLVVSRGGTIEAVGTAEEPIIFTSAADEGDKQKGDWGGLILLGKATNFKGDNVIVEGLPEDDRNKYGGSEDDDDSGTIAYVRIEFGGTEISPMNEINGLTMGSVGSGTTIHHVAVKTTLDDCFEWFGGTVNVDHLVCVDVGDDMFDADQGYRGTLDTLLGISVAPISTDPNGFEMDGDLAEAEPATDITASNVTLCGTGESATPINYGMVLRERVEGTFTNLVISGFHAAVDARDPFVTGDDPHVTIENSILFEGAVQSVAYDEVDTDTPDAPTFDDDEGFDERAWFADGEGNVSFE
jgi:hypothetical protein